MIRLALAMLLALAATGCKKDAGSEKSAGGEAAAVDDRSRCPRPEEDERTHEVSVYDTSGDAKPDVRKVYLVFEEDFDRQTVLICREADLNGDGVKDVVRFYDDDGSPEREESDRNFDGKIDLITVFDGGQVVRKELDENFDGRIESKLFYEEGRVFRIERDLAGRDPKTFRTDRWEYVEEGRVVRIGADLDGDGKVDRWDRDTDRERARRAMERRSGEDDAAEEPAAAEECDEASEEPAATETSEEAPGEPEAPEAEDAATD